MKLNEKDAESSVTTIHDLEDKHEHSLPCSNDTMSAVVVAGIPGPTIAVDQNDSCSLSLSVAPEKSFWRSQPPFYPEIKGDPREGLSRRRKAVILFVISQAGSLAGFSSTIYFPSLVQISEDLNASQTSINASVSLFILFMGVAPLITSTLSDTFKIRRILYLVYAVVFTVASFGGGYSNSAAPLILARIFQAVGSGGATILGAGTITDIYPPAEQGTSMGLFFLGQFLGPVLGPPIGGLLAHAFGWRSTFYFMAIVSVVVILELFFFLPETYRVEPEDLDSLETKGLPTRTKKGFVNPFKAVFLLRHPVIILSAIELGMVFGLMFSIETIVPELFTSRYGLNEFETGLTYLGAGVGSVIGAMMGGKLSDLSLVRGQRRNGGEAILEDRLSITMWIAAYIIVPLGALLFAWSAQDHLHIAVPIVGFSIYNFGMGQVMSAGSAYVVNAIPGQGSSATAAVGCLRMIFACIFSLTAQLIVDSIGYGNYGIIMAVINIVCTLVFHIVKFKGAKMRAAAAKIEQNKNS